MNFLKDKSLSITEIKAQDIRFPTSLKADGSDAMHKDPDYSCVYVTIKTEKLSGYGMTFTLGRGNEIVLKAVNSLTFLVKNRLVHEIFSNFGNFWRELTSETQLRWIGPEKGVMHLATAAIINALWDLWARIEEKPVWKLLSDMEPEMLVSTIDFRYITDVITKDEAIDLLKSRQENGKNERIKELLANGYPAYTTQVGWIGYSDEKIKSLCKEYLAAGYTAFKIKVGQNLENDIKRCQLVRDEIGYEKILMVDANQVWDVQEAISWMSQLANFKPLWIEEPTSPDDILGHATIARALEKFGIYVATGEMCANRVMFKQFLQARALEFCQIDSARIGGVNEILSVYLMAAKLGVKVCPHAGGVGLCEMVQHLQMWDFVSLSGTKENRWIEFVDQQHEHFVEPAIVRKACYMPPTKPGYSTKFKADVIDKFEYPGGSEWQKIGK
ncbi:mitochondrial enolase superfamily member 1-like [Culicoides brevitarsis]|uniref:mitochondrial enolase superfamily member 1-like n=1 Tax=Culicoides brevitarsis TaxID=469753 RepID=UPI00307BAC18